MNAQAAIVSVEEVEMSDNGLVTIPPGIRRMAGLVPGARLVIGINDLGQAVLMTRTQAKRLGESPEQRRDRIKSAIDRVAGKYDFGGGSTDEIMRDLRGDRTP